jgi:hypothetical protein
MVKSSDRWLSLPTVPGDYHTAYQNEPYPVYLIAAEGGGLYAAQFTASGVEPVL